MVDLYWIFKDIIDFESKNLSFESLASEAMFDVTLMVVFLENHCGSIFFDNPCSSWNHCFMPLSIVSAVLINLSHLRRYTVSMRVSSQEFRVSTSTFELSFSPKIIFN